MRRGFAGDGAAEIGEAHRVVVDQIVGLALDVHPAVPQDKVPNGIAYDVTGDRLFVTGKLWSSLYQITLVGPKAPVPDVCQRIR